MQRGDSNTENGGPGGGQAQLRGQPSRNTLLAGGAQGSKGGGAQGNDTISKLKEEGNGIVNDLMIWKG